MVCVMLPSSHSAAHRWCVSYRVVCVRLVDPPMDHLWCEYCASEVCDRRVCFEYVCVDLWYLYLVCVSSHEGPHVMMMMPA